MDPDPEAGQQASQILKTAFVSVIFSTCHYFPSEKTFSFVANNQSRNLPVGC